MYLSELCDAIAILLVPNRTASIIQNELQTKSHQQTLQQNINEMEKLE